MFEQERRNSDALGDVEESFTKVAFNVDPDWREAILEYGADGQRTRSAVAQANIDYIVAVDHLDKGVVDFEKHDENADKRSSGSQLDDDVEEREDLGAARGTGYVASHAVLFVRLSMDQARRGFFFVENGLREGVDVGSSDAFSNRARARLRVSESGVGP
ncbi:hypothetical protein EV126DRAFT_460901 [Verticillium dahliae]|nr:hypothetical protein EV126DRAFT_460901 [Verticillium dahliae]